MKTSRRLVQAAAQWMHTVPSPETGQPSPVLKDNLHQGAEVFFPEGTGTVIDYDPEVDAFLVNASESETWIVPSRHLYLVKEDVKPYDFKLTKAELKHECLSRGYTYSFITKTYYINVPSSDKHEGKRTVQMYHTVPMTQENVLDLPMLLKVKQ